MSHGVTSGVFGFVFGVAAAGAAVYLAGPRLIILENEANYPFDASVQRLKRAAAAHGWKVPAVHDLQRTMAKHGIKVKPVKVVELCNPHHAEKILGNDDQRIVSAMMPCRVAVYEKGDGKVYLSRLNTGLMSRIFGGRVHRVMGEAGDQSEAILAAVLK